MARHVAFDEIPHNNPCSVIHLRGWWGGGKYDSWNLELVYMLIDPPLSCIRSSSVLWRHDYFETNETSTKFSSSHSLYLTNLHKQTNDDVRVEILSLLCPQIRVQSVRRGTSCNFDLPQQICWYLEVDMYIPGYYKRNRHFQCCIEKKLLTI